MNPMLPRRWRCLRGLRPLMLIDANLLLYADTDFARFPELGWVNPLR